MLKGVIGAFKILYRLGSMENGTPQPVPPHSILNDDQIKELNRLRLLSKFVNASEKAKEIELEWQRIQQDEHDALFSVAVSHGLEESKNAYAYKKGIAEGVKWAINRFS